jgi:spore germination protein KC
MLKISRILALALIFAMLASCGFRDIDKRFFVVVIGIDKGETKACRVSLKLAIPAPQIRPGDEKFEVVSKEADTVAQAIRLLKSDVDKEFDFGHAKMIVLGKEYAKDSLAEKLDIFFRRRDIQQSSFIAIGEPTAAEILQIHPKSERTPGNALLLSFGREGTDSSYIATAFLFDTFRRLKETGKDPFLPIIKAVKDTFEINRVAVYNKEIMKAILSRDETRLFNELVRGRTRFEIRSDESDPPYTLAVQDFNSSYTISTPKNGKPTVNLDVKIRGIAEEASGELFNRDWNELERSAAELTAKRYKRLLEKLQEHGVDPIGLGLKFIATRHNAERDWEEWQKIYPEVDFNVNVKVRLMGTGLIR